MHLQKRVAITSDRITALLTSYGVVCNFYFFQQTNFLTSLQNAGIAKKQKVKHIIENNLDKPIIKKTSKKNIKLHYNT